MGGISWALRLSTLPFWLQPPQCRHAFNGLLLKNVPVLIAANIGTQTVSARVPSLPTLPRGAPQYKYSSAVRNVQPMGQVPPVAAPQVTTLRALMRPSYHASVLVPLRVSVAAGPGQPRGSVYGWCNGNLSQGLLG